MDQQDEFAEFYITCNPPLLPRGVKHIINSVKSACTNGELYEILYEPDIPWFKCFTMGKHKESVTRIIQDLMLELVNLEVARPDFDVQKDVVDTDVLQADATMKAPEPRLASWMVYQSHGTDKYDEFIEYQYPAFMASLPHKAIWRGLENSSGSFENFLSAFRLLIKSENAPATTADFALCNDCQITCNMRQNLVYIGSSTSAAALKKVLRKLETMLNLLSTKVKVVTHSILPEGPEDVRLAYRWLHRIGLHQATFAVPCGNLTIANEYALLLNAAAIRMEKKNKVGRWVPDETVYPLQSAPKTNVGQGFKVFKNFHPRPKPRFADIRPMPYGPQPAGKEASSSAEAQEPKPDAGNMESAMLGQGAEDCHGAPGPELSGGENLPLDEKPPILGRQTHTSAVKEEDSAELVQRSRFVETLLLNSPPPQSYRDNLIDWVEGVEDVAPSESEINDFKQDELLISFDASSNESLGGIEAFNAMEPSPMNDELRSLHEGIMQLDQFEQSDDLILLDNEPEAPRANIVRKSDNDLADMCLLSGEIPQIENAFCPVLDKDATALDESNPLEAWKMNAFSDGLVRFGLIEETPRKVYRTMNQQAGRANSKATKGSAPHQLEEAACRERIQKKLDALGPPTEQKSEVKDVPKTREVSQDSVSGPPAEKPSAVKNPPSQADSSKDDIFTITRIEKPALSQKNISLANVVLPGPAARRLLHSQVTESSNVCGSSAPRRRSPGKSSVATVGERPTVRAPAKRGPNPVCEDEFPPLGGGPSSSKKQVRNLVSYSDAAKLSSSRPPQKWQTVANLQTTNEQVRPLSTEVFPLTSGVGKRKSKEPKDTIPENHFDYAVPQKSDILRRSEDCLKAMSQVLEPSPGHVSLEVIFGRIYIKKLAPSMVKDSASEYSYQSVTEAANFLNGSKFPPDCVGFSPILSTMGGDADLLANITPPGDLPWRLSEREIWYDFQCKLPDSRDESFVLELNAKTFQYRCRGPRKELFSMYMHCPGRAWDMKARGARSSALGGEARFVCFAASLFEHMAIHVNDNNGDVTIEFSENAGLNTAVKSITMRQVAEYRHQGKADNSLLSITMKYILKEGISPVMCDRNRIKIADRRNFTTPDGSANSALPHQYMEASITSARLSSLFEENVQLESGNKAAWDMDLLDGEGVFGDILRPAFGMVTHMDSIGASNNTRRYVSNTDAFHEPVVVSTGKKKMMEFW
ncbi:uncharacterized protein TrAtP1_004454 [Trichoderma atroviride]|uniref:uncharacterized protein n=1 Tax=Hypocrea atroviridis TaxID=63577 RepID=UPI003330D00F|nr:hypothetical protein TrAtP1_004454 [Trichoderma atroviride]